MTPIAENRTFTHRALIVIGLITLTILLVWGAIYVIDVILLVFAAALLAVFLRGLAELIRRYTGLSEGISVLVVAVLLIGILALAITLLAPSVADEVRHLRQELPKSAEQAGAYLREFSWGKAIDEQLPSFADVMERIGTANLLTRVGGYFSSTVGAIANFFIVILLAIYLATEPQTYIKGFSKLFTFDKRLRVVEVFNTIGETLQMWLVGKVASMLFIGLLTWVGLWIIGVPLSFTLGLIAGLLSFIPNFGPIMSAVPAILLAFIDSPIKAVYVIGLYVVVQLIESNVVTPIIERETVELPPALTIVAQLALSVLIGGLGLVLATPILAVIMVIVQTVYIEDVLGDKNTDVEKKNLEDERETTGKNDRTSN